MEKTHILIAALILALLLSLLNDVIELIDASKKSPASRPMTTTMINSQAHHPVTGHVGFGERPQPGQTCQPTLFNCDFWQRYSEKDQERIDLKVTPENVVLREPLAGNFDSFDNLRAKIKADQPVHELPGLSAECTHSSSNVLFNEQADAYVTDLDEIVKRLVQPSVYEDAPQEIAFSLLNKAYAFALPHHWQMVQRFVPHKVFYIAMDVEAAEAACQAGAPFISYPKSRVRKIISECANCPAFPEKRFLAAHVALAKFEPVRDILKRDIAVFFLEMDVFVMRPLKSVLKPYSGAFLAVGGHQDFCSAPNIGVYRVLPKTNTTRMFDWLVSSTILAPEQHDQNLFVCAMFHLVGDKKCEGVDHTMQEPFFQLQRTRMDIKDPELPWWRAHHEAHFIANRGVALYDAHVIINIESPLANGDMAIAHFLSGMPLRVPAAKAMIGKEMGLWHDDEYYQNDRYIALDGSLYAGIAMAWQNENNLVGGTLAALTTLAMITNRTLILPTILGRWRYLHAWEYIDVRYLEAMGVSWRESSFLSNRRVPPVMFKNAARLYAFPDNIGVQPFPDSDIDWHKPQPIHSQSSNRLNQQAAHYDYMFGLFSTMVSAATTTRSKGGVSDSSILLVRIGDADRSSLSMFGFYLKQTIANAFGSNQLRTDTKATQPFFDANDEATAKLLAPIEVFVDVLSSIHRMNGFCVVPNDVAALSYQLPVCADKVCANPAFGVKQ